MTTLFLCGDVMPGRGVDQLLPHAGDPRLREPYVRDARHYVRLVERRSGPVPRPVPYSWPWGSALDTLDAMAPDVRVVNLETAVTTANGFAPGKSVHYRMSPRNLPSLLAARPDVCVLANNHVLDFGGRGLRNTLDAVTAGGSQTVGAGRDSGEAAEPAVLPVPGGRVVVFAAAAPSSGVPPSWAATPDACGVHRLPDLSRETADAFAASVAVVKRAGDLVVVSLHWGGNWGYGVPVEHVEFAHRLIDAGVDVVHGHSSHHPRPIEVYRNRLVLYGCGDLINDYEGISGFERYRGDLRLLYFPSFDPGSGELAALRLVPLLSRRLRLHPTGSRDRTWVRSVLTRCGAAFGTRVENGAASGEVDGALVVSWPSRGFRRGDHV